MRIGIAAAIVWSSVASAQTYYYNGYPGGSPYNATAYGAAGTFRGAAGAAGGYGVGPASYTWVHPHLGTNVAPNTGVPAQPQVTGRVMPRAVRYVPIATRVAPNPNRGPDQRLRAVAATGPATTAREAQPNAEGFVTVPREKAGDETLQPVALRLGAPPAPLPTMSAPPTTRATFRPIAYAQPLRGAPRNAVQSAYATPAQSRDGKADWSPIR